MSLRPHMNLPNLVKIFRDTVPGSRYEKAVQHIRKNPFFYQSQAIQQMGLHSISTSSLNTSPAGVMARIYDNLLTRNTHKPTKNYFYTFGWLGALSATLRYEDNKILHASLVSEIKKIRARGMQPKVRLIGYSHGANICLELPLIEECGDTKEKLIVDELWFIGMPVQDESDYLVNRPMFKKVWHFYSYGDFIQKLDSTSFRRFFSRQSFCKRFNFTPSEKLTQVRLKVTSFVHKNCAKNGYVEEAVNMDPGHIELWSFGWSPSSYREEFPLYPIPIVAFLPLIAHHAQQDNNLIREIIAEIQPSKEKIILRNKASTHHRRRRRACTYKSTVPFLSIQEFDQLKKRVWRMRPTTYTEKNYSKHVRTAKLYANKKWKEEYEALGHCP